MMLALRPTSPTADTETPIPLRRVSCGGHQELGAEVSQGEEVLKIVEEGGRVTGVETSKRTISTETVVLAGGAWSKGLGAGVGLDLPINCMMLSIGVLKRPPVLHGTSSRLHRCV